MNFVGWLMRRWFGGIAKYNPWRLHCAYVFKLWRDPLNWMYYLLGSLFYMLGIGVYSTTTADVVSQFQKSFVFGMLIYAAYGVVLYVHAQYLHYRNEREELWNQLSKE